MSYSTTQSAEVGAFIVRFALCPVLAALGILLMLVYPSGQNGNSHPGNGTTLVTLPTLLAANRTHPGVNHSTVAIRYLPTNLHDPNAILIASIMSIAVGIGYIIHQAQRVDETRKIESSSREDYHDRSWNRSFSQELQEVCRNADKGDRVVSFFMFSTTGLCCLAAWMYRTMDKVFGQAVPPSAERLEEFSKMADGDLVLGAQALPWNYTREAWVCGWKGMVLDPTAASRFSTACTRINVSYFLISAILLVVLISLLTSVQPSLFDRESPATDQTISIIRLRYKDWVRGFSSITHGLKNHMNEWRGTRLGRWTRVASDDGVGLDDEERGGGRPS